MTDPDPNTIRYYKDYVSKLTDEQIDRDLPLALDRILERENMKEPLIYLDMDGVCCNFVQATCDLFGWHYADTLKGWDRSTYLIAERKGITQEEFWGKIDAAGKEFWRRIPEYPWFGGLLEFLKKQGRVIFLSSPSYNPDCIEGKLHWLQDRFGSNFRDYIFTNQKHLLSREKTFLLDDSDAQVLEFMDHGLGIGILFPQPWNHEHREPNPKTIVAEIEHELHLYRW